MLKNRMQGSTDDGSSGVEVTVRADLPSDTVGRERRSCSYFTGAGKDSLVQNAYKQHADAECSHPPQYFETGGQECDLTE